MTSKEALKNVENTKTNHIKSEKLGQPRKMYLVKEIKKEEIKIIKQDLEKLEQYKQLEEKLGCSLITIFEALENGAWVKSKEWGLCKWGMPNIFNTYDSGNTPKSQPELQFKKSGRYEYFKIKDYGKTWSLRKEDLEDDK